MTFDKDEITGCTKPTFIVNVLYQQNASWQGTIRWVEGDKQQPFRSVLELIRIMDGVVSDSERNAEAADNNPGKITAVGKTG